MCVSCLLFVSLPTSADIILLLFSLLLYRYLTYSDGPLNSLSIASATHSPAVGVCQRHPSSHHRHRHFQSWPCSSLATGPGNPLSTSGARTTPTTRSATAITVPATRTSTNTVTRMTPPRPLNRCPGLVRVQPSHTTSNRYSRQMDRPRARSHTDETRRPMLRCAARFN